MKGAYLLMRRQALEEVGRLDEGFFMYGEEMDWCRRAQLRRWKIFHLPFVRILHIESSAAQQSQLPTFRAFYNSKFHFYRKYKHPLSVVGLGLVVTFKCVMHAILPRKWPTDQAEPQLTRLQVRWAYLEIIRSIWRSVLHSTSG